MISKVISGGQTGVDQAALRAARACGIATGGWATKCFTTEAGFAPWLADFGLVETTSLSYPLRTELNVRDSAGTLWVGDPGSPGGRLTSRLCLGAEKPLTILNINVIDVAAARVLMDWVYDGCVVNVAGNRESRSPGIGAKAEEFLVELFRMLKGEPS